MDIGMSRESRIDFSSVLVVVFVVDPIARLGDRPFFVGDDVAHGSRGW